MPPANDVHALAGVGLMTADPVGYRARVTPEKTAIIEIATGRRLSYAELDRHLERCAGWLSREVSSLDGARIAALGRNSIAQVVLAMACQRSGAIFVPLNWRLTGPELAALVGDCAPAVLFHDAEFAASAAASGAARREMLDLAAFADAEPLLGVAPSSAPAALLYTSGTTGAPKGVIITRQNAFFAALNFALVGEIGPASVVLADLPLFHTIGLVAVTRTTLTMGGTLVLSDRFLAARSLACFSDPAVGVSHYFCVPQMAAALRAEPGYVAGRLAHLHAIFLGGAPPPQALIEAFLGDGVALVNGYGMSEAGTVAHIPIDRAAIAAHPSAIGLPAPLLETRIVGLDGIDVADGEAGELWIRGPSVTPGYWQRPAETAAAFIDGWLRTGDLVRRAADGFLSVVDRLKDMYISGGENVYPAEVEAALLALTGIADAAVVGVPDARWGEVGVAVIVAPAGQRVTEAEIRAHCTARLARYKCPARLVFAESIPRTPAGKVQKHLLRQTLDLSEPRNIA